MRVLLIANNYPRPNHPFDGMFNLRAAQALQSRGHDVRVLRFVPFRPPFTRYGREFGALPARYEIEGTDVTIVRAFLGPRSFGMGTLGLQLRSHLRALAREFRPDAVHAHGLLEAGAIAEATDLPFIVTGHGSESYVLPWRRPAFARLARTMLERASAVAAVSEFVAAHLRRLGRERVEIVRNGADDSIFYPRDRHAARAALNLHPAQPVIAYAGQLTAAKGLFELADAAGSIAGIKPVLLLAGDGAARDALRSRFAELDVDARFLGMLAQNQLAEAMAAADVFTLPSHAEGLPTVLCEAMNAGRAVVATNVGGIPEIVRDGETGIVVPPKDPPALARALRSVLEAPDMRDRYEGNARAFAQTHLTWRANAAAYELLYERVAAAEKRTAAACDSRAAAGAAPNR